MIDARLFALFLLVILSVFGCEGTSACPEGATTPECAPETGAGGASGGTGGAGGGTAFTGEGFPLSCPGCLCEGRRLAYEFTTTLDCFCCEYQCDPALGPFGDPIDDQWINEYDCDRREIVNLTENPTINFLIDTTTGETVGAAFNDDSGVCGEFGERVEAGDWDLEGCELVSERMCEGACDSISPSSSTATE